MDTPGSLFFVQVHAPCGVGGVLLRFSIQCILPTSPLHHRTQNKDGESCGTTSGGPLFVRIQNHGKTHVILPLQHVASDCDFDGKTVEVAWRHWRGLTVSCRPEPGAPDWFRIFTGVQFSVDASMLFVLVSPSVYVRRLADSLAWTVRG